MWMSHFHVFTLNYPKLRLEGNFVPPCASDFDRSGEGVQLEFKGTSDSGWHVTR